MTVAQYVRLLRERWTVVAVTTVLFSCTAAAFAVAQTPHYLASTEMLLSISRPQADSTEIHQGSTFINGRIGTYAGLATGEPVLGPVITHLRLGGDVHDLARRVTVTNPKGTQALLVTVRDTSPARARDIAADIAAVLPGALERLETPADQNIPPITVSVTAAAQLPRSPASPRRATVLAFGVVLGLGTGAMLATARPSRHRHRGTPHEPRPAVGATGRH